MARTLSYAAVSILKAVADGVRYGFDIADRTGLQTGTVYPALRRLEAVELVRSDWEPDRDARQNGRPRRRYYELTAAGRRRLVDAETRYRALTRLFPGRSTT